MSDAARKPSDGPDEVIWDQLSNPVSAVAVKEQPWGFVLGLAGTVGLGLVVFLTLSAGRHAKAQTSAAPVSPVPAVVAPPAAPQTLQPSPSPLTAPMPPPPAPTDEDARLHAPSMIVDLSDASENGAAPAAAQGGATANTPGGGGKESGAKPSADERFADRVSGSQVDIAHATRIANPATTAPQGTVISAVLETGINSDLPGFVRAVVSRDVSGFDGTTVLIPKGSKLIGEYKSGVAVGQSRAFVIWSRLITPEGVSINLGSPATDRLGRGGLSGEVNTHFLQRFGSAILLSVVSAGLQVLANEGSSNSTNAIIIGTPQQATNVATVALQKDIDIPTTITVPQGQSIRVFVTRDLDFSDVIAAR